MSERLSLSYPSKMKEKLLELAKEENRPLSNYVQIVLDDHLKEKGMDVDTIRSKEDKAPRGRPKKVVKKPKVIKKRKRVASQAKN